MSLPKGSNLLLRSCATSGSRAFTTSFVSLEKIQACEITRESDDSSSVARWYRVYARWGYESGRLTCSIYDFSHVELCHSANE